MNKKKCLKQAKLFLKMTECNLTLIGALKVLKMITTVALALNLIGFLLIFCFNIKKMKP